MGPAVSRRAFMAVAVGAALAPLGGCAVVTKDVPDNCVVAGVPARVVKRLG